MQCAIYGRVSTNEAQGKQEVENQLIQLRAFAEQQGWSVYREYIDRLSGKTGDRAEFQTMFNDASMGRFSLVLFWSLDRLTRQGALATLKYLERLAGYKVGYRSLTEPYLDSLGPFSEGIVGLLGCIARQERLRISERVKAGLARRKSKGLAIGRQPKVLDLTRAQELQASGLSIRQIALEMGVKRGLVHKRLTASRQNGGAIAGVLQVN